MHKSYRAKFNVLPEDYFFIYKSFQEIHHKMEAEEDNVSIKSGFYQSGQIALLNIVFLLLTANYSNSNQMVSMV
jgi:hypothetical protein